MDPPVFRFSGNTLTAAAAAAKSLQSCLTLCDPMNHSTPGLTVHHQLLEFPQTHVHWVSDAIQPPHPLSSPFLPAFNLSQHQGLFKWVCFSHQVAEVLEFQLQHQSFWWIFRTDFLQDWLVGSPCSPRVFSNTTVQKHQFFASCGHNIGVLALASVLSMTIQDWFPSGLTGWISLQSKGLSRVFSNTTVRSITFSALSFLYSPSLTSVHDHWKNHSLD